MADPVVRVQSVSKRFGRALAVDGLSFVLYPGEIVGLLGPNGSGKTTTIKLMLGLLRPSAGTVELFGRAVERGSLGAFASRVGAMIEAPAFYPWMSGRDNLRTLARMAGLSEDVVDATLERVGLGDAARRKASTYSVGMKQRMGLAIALLRDPPLIILDEPTTGLDPAGQRDTEVLLRRLRNDGRTVLLASHQLGEVERICDRFLILDRGRKLFDGSRDALPPASNRFRVRVQDRARAAGILSRVPGVAAVAADETDSAAMFVEAPLEAAGAITAVLVHAGITVEEVRPVEDTLEALFFKLTGRRDAA